MSGDSIRIVNCEICKKPHQVRIMLRKKFGTNNQWTNWRYFCSIQCLQKHEWYGHPKSELKGLNAEEVQVLIENSEKIENKKQIIDVEWSSDS
jgi:hypothetical protein